MGWKGTLKMQYSENGTSRLESATSSPPTPIYAENVYPYSHSLISRMLGGNTTDGDPSTDPHLRKSSTPRLVYRRVTITCISCINVGFFGNLGICASQIQTMDCSCFLGRSAFRKSAHLSWEKSAIRIQEFPPDTQVLSYI